LLKQNFLKMANKIEQGELEALQKQQEAKAKIQADLGALELQKHSLLHAFAQVQGEQDELTKSLEEKFGKIQVDLKTGEFSPIEDDAKDIEVVDAEEVK
jgi:hypothetical protein